MSAAMFFTYLRNCGTSLLPSLSASLSPSPLLRRFRRVSSSSDPLQSIHILGESCRFNMGLLNNSIENSTLDCPIYTKDSEYWMEFINFWVGGVVQTLFILFGFVGKFVKEVKEHNAKSWQNYTIVFAIYQIFCPRKSQGISQLFAMISNSLCCCRKSCVHFHLDEERTSEFF